MSQPLMMSEGLEADWNGVPPRISRQTLQLHELITFYESSVEVHLPESGRGTTLVGLTDALILLRFIFLFIQISLRYCEGHEI